MQTHQMVDIVFNDLICLLSKPNLIISIGKYLHIIFSMNK